MAHAKQPHFPLMNNLPKYVRTFLVRIVNNKIMVSDLSRLIFIIDRARLQGAFWTQIEIDLSIERPTETKDHMEKGWRRYENPDEQGLLNDRFQSSR